MIIKKFLKFIKGFIIGTSMLIPGMSGGTMAVILDVFDELVSLVSNLKSKFKENILPLLLYGLGVVFGLILLSKPILSLFEHYPLPSYYFFIGAILGTLPVLFSKLKGDKIKIFNFIFFVVGLGVALSILFIPKGLMNIDLNSFPINIIYFLLIGFIIAVAMILPGISGSYILLIFGLYENVLLLIGDFNLFAMTFMGVGALLGIFTLSKLLDKEIKRHPQATYLLIMGFLIGSLVQIFPGLPDFSKGFSEGGNIFYPLISFVTLIAGFLIIFLLFLFSKRNEGGDGGGKKVIDEKNKSLK